MNFDVTTTGNAINDFIDLLHRTPYLNMCLFLVKDR